MSVITDELEIPARLIDALAKQMYGRAMRRRRFDTGWYELSRDQRAVWVEDARILIEPMYREIADDLERRMMRTEVINVAIRAFNAPRLKGSQPIEEGIQAAWARAIKAGSPRRTLEAALRRLAGAGKELGGGIPVASEFIGPGEPAMKSLGFKGKDAAVASIGVAIGLLMQGDSETEEVLERIAVETFDDPKGVAKRMKALEA